MPNQLAAENMHGTFRRQQIIVFIKIRIGQVLEILTTDPGSKKDIPIWAKVTKQELLSFEERGPEDFRFLVKRQK